MLQDPMQHGAWGGSGAAGGTSSSNPAAVTSFGDPAAVMSFASTGAAVLPASSPAAVHVSEAQQALLPKPLPPPAPGQPQRCVSGVWRQRYAVVLLAVIVAGVSADQNLLAPNLSAAAAYFGLDDHAKDTVLGGWLMAAFFAIGAPAALLCGYFADQFNRIHMLAVIVLVGEAPCLCTYWVTQLWQFFLVRMLTGITVGGTFPLVFSLLGDLAPASQRAALASIIQIAVGGGIAAGQMLAGLIGPATNWRTPFVVVSAPTLLLTALLVVTVPEPQRGGCEAALADHLSSGASYSERVSWAKVSRVLRVPSNWIIVLQGLPGSLPWGCMQVFITDYLHVSKGFSVELASTIILTFGLGSGVGVVAGGTAGQALYNWRKETMPLFIGCAVVAGAGPVLFIVNGDLQALGLWVTLGLSALAGFLVSIAAPNIRAVVLNVNPPEARGVALALQSVTDDLGKGLGPVIVAAFISQLGRVGAFNLAIAGWAPCGLLLACLMFTMRSDENAMQARLAQSLQTITTDGGAPGEPSQPPAPPAGPADAASSSGRSSTSADSDASSPGGGPPRAAGPGRGIRRALLRPFSRGSAVAPAGAGLQVCGGSNSGRAAAGGNEPPLVVAVPVLASADTGSIELQQLLIGMQHHPQQRQGAGHALVGPPCSQLQHCQPQPLAEGVDCSSSASSHAAAMAGSAWPASGSTGSSCATSAELGNAGSSVAVAAGACHRGGRGVRRRGGSWGGHHSDTGSGGAALGQGAVDDSALLYFDAAGQLYHHHLHAAAQRSSTGCSAEHEHARRSGGRCGLVSC